MWCSLTSLDSYGSLGQMVGIFASSKLGDLTIEEAVEYYQSLTPLPVAGSTVFSKLALFFVKGVKL
jgi:hypothetical protein